MERFKEIVDEVVRVEILPGVVAKIRVVMVDGSFLDIYWSPSGRYSLHYERRHIDGRVYRHDNAPHSRHRHVRTFPKHYHDGSENNVVESNLPDEPVKAVEEFLETIREILGVTKAHRARRKGQHHENPGPRGTSRTKG